MFNEGEEWMNNSEKRVTEEIINTVFGNKKSYDKSRYIPRKDCQTELIRKLNRYQCLFITGESGCGKTWLTEYVLSENNLKENYINMAEIKYQGGLIKYFENSIPKINEERKEIKEAAVKIPVAEGILSVESTYKLNNDILWSYIKQNKNKVIVFDNFENIINDTELLNELSCLITLVDDKRMIDANVKFIIIGALSDVVRYFQQMPNYKTIASRISTITVNGFSENETHDFVIKGFGECGFPTGLGGIARLIHTHSDGIPQAVNELCYFIALTHFDGKEKRIEPESDITTQAVLEWIKDRMIGEYSILLKFYEENLKDKNENNMILYSLKEFGTREFSVSQLKSQIDAIFGEKGDAISLKKIRDYLLILAEDSSNSNILVRKNEEGYKQKSFKTYACLNQAIYLDDNVIKCIELK